MMRKKEGGKTAVNIASKGNVSVFNDKSVSMCVCTWTNLCMYSIVLAKSRMHSIHYLGIQIETEKGKRDRQRDRKEEERLPVYIYTHTQVYFKTESISSIQ